MHKNVDDLNARLWAWLDEIYHHRPHEGFDDDSTPLQRWRDDLAHVRPLGHLSHKVDELFYHRIKRKTKKDGTVSYEGKRFEVPYELCGKTIYLVVDPESQQVIKVESLDGETLGFAHPLDKQGNTHRTRQRPKPDANISSDSIPDGKKASMVELAHQSYQKRQLIEHHDSNNSEQEEW